MRIGFWKEEITPEVGVELGGYAGYRPCTGVHDPLWCRCVVLEQEKTLFCLVQLDLMCADEEFCTQVARQLAPLGIEKNHLLITAIHSHCAPCGVVPGRGLMADISLPGYPVDNSYFPYLEKLLSKLYEACEMAKNHLESFAYRIGQVPAPPVGSERHTGIKPDVMLTVMQVQTETGKNLILYNFPCHPTVMGPANLEVTADFTAGIELQLPCDMAVFLNGAAGDISTRYTRTAQNFRECERLGTIAASAIWNALESQAYQQPAPLMGIRKSFSMKVRPVEPVAQAQLRLEKLTADVRQAEAAGADHGTLRMLKSYVEGAGINLQFARSLGQLRNVELDVSVFRIFDLSFVTIPGELFSTLLPADGTCVIGYANGYNLYIADKAAYDAHYYEALASLFARGEGERLMDFVHELLMQLENK